MNTASSILNNLDSDLVLTLRESTVGKALAASIAVLQQTHNETATALAAFEAADALSKRNKSRAAIIAALTPANEAALERRRNTFKAYYAARQSFIADRHADRIEAAASVVEAREPSSRSVVRNFAAAAAHALKDGAVRAHAEFIAADNGIVGRVTVCDGKVDDVSFSILAHRDEDARRQWTCIYVRSESFARGAYLSTIGTSLDSRDSRAYAQATVYAADVQAVLEQADREGAAPARDLTDALFPIEQIG